MENNQSIVSDRLKKKLWLFSNLTSLLALFFLVFMAFFITHHYESSSFPIENSADITNYIEQYKKTYSISEYGEPILVPTGLFIQSFYFRDPNTVIVSGFLWQKYPNNSAMLGIKQGFIFPESNADVVLHEIYRQKTTSYELIGWRFTGAALYQPFDYSRYPFDQQSVWIRIWDNDFFKNIILIPDLDAYRSTKLGTAFGLESDLVLKDYTVKETNFSYENYKYDTNFGIKNYVSQLHSPELIFKIVIKRKFLSSFILYLLPIFVIWGILFGLTFVITGNKPLADKNGFSTTRCFSVLGAALFTVILTNINFRYNFSGQPITYLEYFYFITYAIISLLALDAYFITANKVPFILKYEDNFIPKVIFWPLLLITLVILTAWQFFYLNVDVS